MLMYVYTQNTGNKVVLFVVVVFTSKETSVEWHEKSTGVAMKHTASTVLYCPIKICQFKQTHIQLHTSCRILFTPRN